MTDSAGTELSSHMLKETSTDLRKSTEQLKSAGDCLIALRGELDGAGDLVEIQPAPPTMAQSLNTLQALRRADSRSLRDRLYVFAMTEGTGT